MMQCIVLGASRGLGAALVDELLAKGHQVVGISRTPGQSLVRYEAWMSTGRFAYHQVDLAGTDARDVLVAVRSQLTQERLCIILNAALVAADIDVGGEFLPEVYAEVCRTATMPLGMVLDVFGAQLIQQNGILVGISSVSAWIPPVIEPRIAYPASKAFLEMALRSLRIIWGDRVKVVTVVLGNIGNSRFKEAPNWFIPSYQAAAEKIVRRISGRTLPSTVLIPLPVCLAYKFLNLLPDPLYAWLLNRMPGAGEQKGAR